MLRPWQSITIDQISIKGVPAYSPDDIHYPVEAGGLGFVIALKFYDIYYAGDTLRIPEMGLIKPDIAILPIDGNGKLTVDEAVEVVKEMRPRWVLPSNWGGTEGASRFDAQTFKKTAEEYTEVVLLTQTL